MDVDVTFNDCKEALDNIRRYGNLVIDPRDVICVLLTRDGGCVALQNGFSINVDLDSSRELTRSLILGGRQP